MESQYILRMDISGNGRGDIKSIRIDSRIYTAWLNGGIGRHEGLKIPCP